MEFLTIILPILLFYFAAYIGAIYIFVVIPIKFSNWCLKKPVIKERSWKVQPKRKDKKRVNKWPKNTF
jgi:hypothetical protein